MRLLCGEIATVLFSLDDINGHILKQFFSKLGQNSTENVGALLHFLSFHGNTSQYSLSPVHVT